MSATEAAVLVAALTALLGVLVYGSAVLFLVWRSAGYLAAIAWHVEDIAQYAKMSAVPAELPRERAPV